MSGWTITWCPIRETDRLQEKDYAVEFGDLPESGHANAVRFTLTEGGR